MSIEKVKIISIKNAIETETGLRFKRGILQHCPFCNSGNNGQRNSDSAFCIKKSHTGDYFYCFSCGEGGSVIDFVMKYNNLELKEAIKYLEQRYLGIGDCESKTRNSVRLIPSSKDIPNPDYIPLEWVNKSTANNGENNLLIWLKQQYGEEKSIEAFNLYQVGAAKRWNGATTFFYIDEAQKCTQRSK